MATDNPFNIHIKETPMGKDMSFVITGGLAHIGAIATAYLYNNEIEVRMIELPHHKEGELAKECAVLATNALKCTTTVSIGIHIDNATKEQINSIVDYVRNAMAEKIKYIQSSK